MPFARDPAELPPGHPVLSAPQSLGRLRSSFAVYEIVLAGPVLMCRCFPPDHPPGPIPHRMLADDLALVRVGSDSAPVTWVVAAIAWTNAHVMRVSLRAADWPLRAEAVFALDPETDILCQDTTLLHDGVGPSVPIGLTLGCCITVEERVHAVIHLSGAWTQETQIRALRMTNAPIAMESRTGKTGFGFQPYVALRAPETTWLCQMHWPGNWRLEIEPLDQGALIEGGINPWSFRHHMRDGRTLALPRVLFGRVRGRMNASTQRLHDWRNRHRPDPDRVIPVQFNSWYRYFGEPSATAIMPIIPLAARLGCEAFVLDAGWYRPDDDDSDAEWFHRTGDWRISQTRFPDGLRPISAVCRRLGLIFGLWFEPEVIGTLSSIRTQHPEWLHHLDGRPPADDERAVLHLGVPAAWQHAFDRISEIIRSADVGWMKWDFNADLFAGGWAPGLPEELTDEDPLIAHYRGVFSLQDAIRALFPALILEMCASGGGRMDAAILSHAHVNWISDQPGPLRKLAIHFGSQLPHPAVTCNDWLVEWPPGNIPGYDDADDELRHLGDLPFRLRVAMLGSFGISARVDHWAEADLAAAAAHIAFYRQHLRAVIQHGRQYLLTMPPAPDGGGAWAAIWYTRRDRLGGVLFAFRLAGDETSRTFRLPGLDSTRRYRVRAFEARHWTNLPAPLDRGISVHLPNRFSSALFRVETLRDD
jgi:alpha-galactosidase